MTGDAAPVRCLNCRRAVEQLRVEGTLYANTYATKNYPCGCRDAGVLFDFGEGSGRSDG